MKRYYAVEKGKGEKPLILGKRRNLLSRLFIPSGAKTKEEAEQVKKLAEIKYKKKFRVIGVDLKK